MISDFTIFLTVFLVCLATRMTYEFFKKAGRVDLKNKFLFGVIFTAMCLLWISWFSMCPLDPGRIDLPAVAHWAGLAITLTGLGLAVGALIQLKGLEDIDHLVTTGLFSKLRHPMYTGFICWIVGWSVYHGATISFAVGIAGIACILYWRHLEEVALASYYGDRYTEYRRTTWF